MIAKLTLGLLAVAVLTACETTQTAKQGTLAERRLAMVEAQSTTPDGEPAPPAAGPDGEEAAVPADTTQVPTPLFRNSAASSL